MTSASTTETALTPGLRTPVEIALWSAVGVATLATLRLVANPLGMASGTLTHLLFALPGVLIVRAACGGWLPTIAFGPLLGLALSSVSLLAFWAAGARGPWLLATAPLVLCPLAIPARRMRGRWAAFTLRRSDALWLGLLLALVPLLVARPFSLVGAALPDGEVYRAYFTADYVWRRAVVAELAKGDFLPLNPFFLHDELHYYWLPHLMTAVEYRWLRGTVSVNEILLVNSVIVDLAFVAFLYGIGRWLVDRPAAVAAGVVCSLLFTSFEGLYGMWDHWRIGASITLLENFNVDAISRWLLQAMPIDGLQRVLWYQPHHALGYAIGFIGLLTIVRRSGRVDPTVFAIGGALLGVSTLISSFGGLMLTTAAALHEGAAVVRRMDWRRGVSHLAAAVVPLGIAALLVVALRYVEPGGRILAFGLNKVAVHNVVPGTFLSFGPMIFVAGPGVWLAWRHRRDAFGGLFALLVVCVVFYFFVDIRDHQDVYVGWRVGHMTFISCGALTAMTFAWASTLDVVRRRVAWVAVAAVVLCSAPTLIIDAYNTQDVRNRGAGAGFRLTLVLSPDELDAFRWIREHTRPDAIFQVDPVVRDADTWAYLPAFAERRMSAGLPISMVPRDKYVYESGRIRKIYDEEAGEAFDRARRSGVQFVMVGPPERAAHPGVDARLDSVPDLFPTAFRNGSVTIYKVNGTGP